MDECVKIEKIHLSYCRNLICLNIQNTKSLPLDVFLHWEEKIPDSIFLRQPRENTWRSWTWKVAGDESRRIASALKSYNLSPKSKVAILSKNCAEWIIADIAIMMAGYISVPIYPTLDASSIYQILEHSESSVLFLGKLDNFDIQKSGIPASIRCISFSNYGITEGEDWNSLLEKYSPVKNIHKAEKEDIITIMYTSGTSGKPKGVMISHRAIQATLIVATKDLHLKINPALFSYLPLSHIAERVGIEMVGLYLGGSLSFTESLESFPKNLAETQPTFFFAVPRIWAKFRERILEKIPQKKLDRLLSIPFINTIIKKSIRKKLGLARASHLYVGAASVAPSLLLWFDTLGIEIFQAYAMTENTLYGTFNRHGANKYGTVGQPLSNMELKIGDDQEILMKHNGLMSGYYKEPVLTSESFKDHFFCTGDRGFIDEEGYLTITGRIKDIFKTDKAKYIVPGPIETLLVTNSDIEQACVVGTGIPQPIVLIVLSFSGKNKAKGDVAKSITQRITEVNLTLNPYEQIEKAVIMQEDWTVQNGLMTPSLKIKRNEVEKIHSHKYPEWYKIKDNVVWEE